MVNWGKKKKKGEQPKNPSQHKRTQTLLKNLTRILSRRKGMISLRIQYSNIKKIIILNQS